MTFPLCSTFEYTILCHSEKNSSQVELYEKNGFIGVYYWSHALIARDWFRYAEIDPGLKKHQTTKDFLVYNRAWSGTREYRVRFAEMLLDANLEQHCCTNFNPTDQGQHWLSHNFLNEKFRPQRQDLDRFFLPTSVDSTASADYVAADYCNSRIEVVLETLFDDNRNHLTEKTLRPIACQQPFIIAATPGSLEYLRSYGFRTFEGIWDESYDDAEDSVQIGRAHV